ncbi:hypothetical protein A2U01_0053082, partial [Trifolium medium]|nr:hypothetical protein [Trifolium medium]
SQARLWVVLNLRFPAVSSAPVASVRILGGGGRILFWFMFSLLGFCFVVVVAFCCVMFPLFGGDCDGSEVDVMGGGVVAIDLRWMIESDLR